MKGCLPAPNELKEQMSNSSRHRWNKVWIIGASTGIGKELARAIAPKCQQVWISARDATKLREVANHADNIQVLPLDINDRRQVADAGRAIEQDGPQPAAIDLVVVSSAIGISLNLPKFDAELYRQSMETNYMGTVNVIAEVLPSMVEAKHGHIAMIGSIAGYRGMPGSAPYAPTKAALINLAESLYPSLRQLGITVSIINPGFIATPMTEKNKFKMPFLMQADEAAGRIVRGLDRRKYEIAFPWPMVYLLKSFRLLPNRLFFFLAARLSPRMTKRPPQP